MSFDALSTLLTNEQRRLKQTTSAFGQSGYPML